MPGASSQQILPSRKTRRNASSYGLSKEIIVVVFLFLSIHLYLLHFCSEDSYQTDIKIDDESVKAEVIDTAGNVSRDDGISDKFLVMTLS